MRYTLDDADIIHGDRFYVGKFNKDDEVMMGYGIQQDNPKFMIDYYYDASTGEMKWQHFTDKLVDVGRGNIGDLDPSRPGLEVYSPYGMYNAKTGELISTKTEPFFPSNNCYWDGTLETNCFDRSYIQKWDQTKQEKVRVYTAYKAYTDAYGLNSHSDETHPLFHGDIIGDWREEFILASPEDDELIIFTSDFDTEYRITSLSQDPGMRSSMSVNGYKQSHMSTMYMATDMDIDEERRKLKEYVARRAMNSYEEPTPEVSEPTEDPPTTSTITNSPDEEDSHNSGNKLNSGSIAGIVIAVLVVVAGVAIGLFLYYKKKARNNEFSLQENETQLTSI